MTVVILNRRVDQRLRQTTCGWNWCRLLALNRAKTTGFGPHPNVSLTIGDQRKHMRIREPRDRKDVVLTYAKEACTGSDQHRPIAIGEQARRQLRFKHMKAKLGIRFTRRKMEDPCVGPNPQASVAVEQDRTYGI